MASILTAILCRLKCRRQLGRETSLLVRPATFVGVRVVLHSHHPEQVGLKSRGSTVLVIYSDSECRPYLLRRKPQDGLYSSSKKAAIESATADLLNRRDFVMEKGHLIVNSGGYRVCVAVYDRQVPRLTGSID